MHFDHSQLLNEAECDLSIAQIEEGLYRYKSLIQYNKD